MMTFKLIALATLLSTIFALQACGKRDHDDETVVPEPVQLQEPENDKELRLRGYVELSSVVAASLTNENRDFSFQSYLGGEINPFLGPMGLVPLMGYYSSDPANPGWKNVSANTISTATYLVAFDSLALDLAKFCDPEHSSKQHAEFKDTFKTVVTRYCTSPDLSESDYQEIWQGLTAGLVPASEFKPWMENLKTVASQPAADRFEVMVTTAMASPWLVFKN